MKRNSLLTNLYNNIKNLLFRKEITPKSKLFLKSLAPTVKVEDKSYLNILEWAINKEDITNIALSGAYGSGKSSILKAFEKEYNYKILSISLATFKEKCESLFNQEIELKNTITNIKKEKGEDSLIHSSPDIDQEQIEKSILQQMMYKEKPSTIPNSRFKRIYNPNNLFIISTLFFLWLISFVELYSPYTVIYHLFQYSNISLVYILNIIFYTGMFVLLFYFLKKISSIKLHKLSLQSPEITLNENDSDISILNKHIDEIIYFFEKTEYSIVVIEDLDRFNHPEIYIKLRELNSLLNNSNQIEQPVNFIYAIRDNMFINKERTKFFDFFIPVIPVINATNSFTKLKEMFEKAGIIKEMEQRFLKDISRYIHDMRLLANIFNEFIQFKEHLEKNYELHALNQNKKKEQIPKISYDKLFAIIVYKNHYPADFADLHEHKGLVYKIFNNSYKMEKISNIIKEDEDTITFLKNRIISLNNEKINNFNDLKAIYIYKILEKIPDLIAFNFKDYTSNPNISKTYITKVIEDDELFYKIKESNRIQYWTFSNMYSNNNIQNSYADFNFEDIEKEISEHSFDERVKMIEVDKEKEKAIITEDIKIFEERIAKIKRASIKYLLDTYENEDILPKELYEKNKDLLRYLIKNDYINEHYKQYITYYYPGDETINDITFIGNIRNSVVALDYNLELTQYEKILEDITDDEFNFLPILNFNLLNYLFKRYSLERNKKRISSIIKVCKEYDKYNFIIEFLVYANEKIKVEFINLLLIEWKTFIKDYFDRDITNEEKDEISRLLIEYTKNYKYLTELNNYIKNKETLLDFIIRFKDEEKFIEYISSQALEFSNLTDYNVDSSKVFKYIYENFYYEINPHMIKVMLNIEEENKEFQIQNFTTIINSNKEKVKQCIKEYIEEYIENIYLKLPENTKDTPEALEKLFNIGAISEDYIFKIYKKTEAVFEIIDNLPSCLFETLLRDNRVKPTLYNILKALYNDVVDKKVVAEFLTRNISNFSKYINKEKELDNSKYKSGSEYGDFIESIHNSFETLLISDYISLRVFELVIKEINYKFKKFTEINRLSDEKLDCLISNNYLELNEHTYGPIREHERLDIKIKLFENEQNKIIDFIEYGILNSDIEMILKSKKIKNEIKRRIILEFLTEKMLEVFEFEDVTDEAIFNILINEKITPYQIKEFYYIYLINSKLSIMQKIRLFAKYTSFNHDLIEFTLIKLGYPYMKLKIDGYGTKVSFLNTDYNTLLISKLTELNYIGHVNFNKNRIEVYKLKVKRKIVN